MFGRFPAFLAHDFLMLLSYAALSSCVFPGCVSIWSQHPHDLADSGQDQVYWPLIGVKYPLAPPPRYSNYTVRLFPGCITAILLI